MKMFFFNSHSNETHFYKMILRLNISSFWKCVFLDLRNSEMLYYVSTYPQKQGRATQINVRKKII